jgi:hypothetical protein
MHPKVPNKAAIADAREIAPFFRVSTFYGRFCPLCPAKAHEAWACSIAVLGMCDRSISGWRKNYFFGCCKWVLEG